MASGIDRKENTLPLSLVSEANLQSHDDLTPLLQANYADSPEVSKDKLKSIELILLLQDSQQESIE